MIELSREELKTDKVFNWLFEVVKRNHKVAKHTEKVLYKNRHIKDFCEEAGHFTEIPSDNGKESLYIQYNVASWFKAPAGVQVRIDSIIVFDNFIEYSIAQRKNITEGPSLS